MIGPISLRSSKLDGYFSKTTMNTFHLVQIRVVIVTVVPTWTHSCSKSDVKHPVIKMTDCDPCSLFCFIFLVENNLSVEMNGKKQQ